MFCKFSSPSVWLAPSFCLGPPLFCPPSAEHPWSSLGEWRSTYSNSSDSPSDVPIAWWPSAGYLNLDVSTNELAILPSEHSSSWSMALFSEHRVRSAFPADTWPLSITRVNSVLSAHPWLAGCLSGVGLARHLGFVPISLASDLTQPLAPVSCSALAPDLTRRGAPF